VQVKKKTKGGKGSKKGSGQAVGKKLKKNEPPITLNISTVPDIFQIPEFVSLSSLLKPKAGRNKVQEKEKKEEGVKDAAGSEASSSEHAETCKQYEKNYDIRKAGCLESLLHNAARYNPHTAKGCLSKLLGSNKGNAFDEEKALPSIEKIRRRCLTSAEAKRSILEHAGWQSPMTQKMIARMEPEPRTPKAPAKVLKLDNVTMGTLVRPGPDWEYGDQNEDDGGVVVGVTEDGFAEVQWANRPNRVFAYRVGQKNKYDLSVVKLARSGTSRTSSSRVSSSRACLLDTPTISSASMCSSPIEPKT